MTPRRLYCFFTLADALAPSIPAPVKGSRRGGVEVGRGSGPHFDQLVLSSWWEFRGTFQVVLVAFSREPMLVVLIEHG